MKEILKFIEFFIYKDLERKKFLFLDKNYLYPSDTLEMAKGTFFMWDIIKTKDDTIQGKNRAEKEYLIINNYIKTLKERKLDGRSISRIRLIIADAIEKKYKNVIVVNSKYLYIKGKIKLKIIYSLSDFTDYIYNIRKKSNNTTDLYYRGHANINWKLFPSIYRSSRLVDNEHRMFRDIILRNPKEFVNTKSTFEKLTIMQHYGLPTRLLDITKSPMIALFFACLNKKHQDIPGEVLIFNPSQENVKYFDSDTVSILSNLSKAERKMKILNDKNAYNASYDGIKFLHLIKAEKPYFLGVINPKDFKKALFVKPINNNERIKRQLGYFILFGVDEKIQTPINMDNITLNSNNERMIILIDENNKRSILKELDSIGINDDTLFPEIENGTDFIRNKYLFNR